MEILLHHKKKAEGHLAFAEHMIFVTYPVLEEPKLLLSALEHIFLAFTNGISAYLFYLQSKGMVGAFEDTFYGRYDAYMKCAREQDNLDLVLGEMMAEIRTLLIKRKESPLEFKREDKIVICSDSYDMKIITFDQINNYMAKAKVFIEDINQVILYD